MRLKSFIVISDVWPKVFIIVVLCFWDSSQSEPDPVSWIQRKTSASLKENYRHKETDPQPSAWYPWQQIEHNWGFLFISKWIEVTQPHWRSSDSHLQNKCSSVSSFKYILLSAGISSTLTDWKYFPHLLWTANINLIMLLLYPSEQK